MGDLRPRALGTKRGVRKGGREVERGDGRGGGGCGGLPLYEGLSWEYGVSNWEMGG